jgi:hypothetical protein
MSRLQAAMLSSVFLLAGCEAQPGPGVPRAPLPSEVKPYEGPPAALTPDGRPQPRDLGAFRKAQASEAKKDGDASKAASGGGMAPKPEGP